MPSGWKRRWGGRKKCRAGNSWGVLGAYSKLSEFEQREAWKRPRLGNGRFAAGGASRGSGTGRKEENSGEKGANSGEGGPAENGAPFSAGAVGDHVWSRAPDVGL
jgi:hypothetical protein